MTENISTTVLNNKIHTLRSAFKQYVKQYISNMERMVEMLFSKKKTESPVVLMHYEGLWGFSQS